MAKKSSRKKSRGKGLLFFLIIVLVWWFNNFTLTKTNVCFTDEKINDIITIVQISDLHGAEFGKDNENLIKDIESQNPDLVFVTGDMYTNINGNNGKETALKLMKSLGEKFKVYYVNGEHDNEDAEFFKSMEESGVNVFNYENEIITVKNTTLHLYGINNVYYTDTFDLHNAFVSDSNYYSILLAHASNFKKFEEFGVDLAVCGDTHGGMFRLPFVGAVYDGSVIFPERYGTYMKGTYTLGDSKLFITSGLGNYPLPVRFCNRPEIAVIKLAPNN
ncbi:MAG: metallophosphoesterase [Clostridia bacterium]|nr:metallophosphoesterase [Clostridia bacterium]